MQVMPGGFDEERAAIAAGIHRSHRVCTDNGDRTARNGFQEFTGSGDGAAGSDGGDEWVTNPAVSDQISGPVESRWACGLAGLSY